jgi:hypothetical protein
MDCEELFITFLGLFFFFGLGAAIVEILPRRKKRKPMATRKKMITIKSYSVVLDDGTTGAMSTCFLDAYQLIGKKVNIRARDENGRPVEKRGKLAEILDEWN